jgi:hypothetical protein
MGENNRVTYLEATCPNCETEIQVEVPEEVTCLVITNDERLQLGDLERNINSNKTIMDCLYNLKLTLTGWRNKKARKVIEIRLHESTLLQRDFEKDYWPLYKKLNPDSGEHSTD